MKATKEITPKSKWHVLYTKPRHEIKTLERLAQTGFEVYCPMKTTLKQWSDRKKKVLEPLLPSYIFIKITEKERATPLNDPSVLNYIFWLGKPAIVRDNEIDTLKGIINKEKAQEFEVRNLKIGSEITLDGNQIGKLLIADPYPFGLVNIFDKKMSELKNKEILVGKQKAKII